MELSQSFHVYIECEILTCVFHFGTEQTKEMTSYAEQLKRLSRAYDSADKMRIVERTRLFAKMLQYKELREFAKTEIKVLRLHFQREHNVNGLLALKLALDGSESLELFVPHSTTFYENKQNVHVLSAATVNAALALIDAYGQRCDVYVRPPGFEEFDAFFDELERHQFHAFDPKRLFLAIHSFILESEHCDELMLRLKEEMSDAEGRCLTGCIVRLINALRGFSDQFQVELDEYEAIRAKTFHKLTNAIDPCGDDNMMDQIATAINSGRVKMPSPQSVALRILKDYTGETWIVTRKNVFTAKLNFI